MAEAKIEHINSYIQKNQEPFINEVISKSKIWAKRNRSALGRFYSRVTNNPINVEPFSVDEAKKYINSWSSTVGWYFRWADYHRAGHINQDQYELIRHIMHIHRTNESISAYRD